MIPAEREGDAWCFCQVIERLEDDEDSLVKDQGKKEYQSLYVRFNALDRRHGNLSHHPSGPVTNP